MLADAKASLALVDKLGAILDKDEKQEKSKKLSPLEQSIQFKHVSYSYQGDPAKKEYEISLKDISFDIEAGKWKCSFWRRKTENCHCQESNKTYERSSCR